LALSRCSAASTLMRSGFCRHSGGDPFPNKYLSTQMPTLPVWASLFLGVFKQVVERRYVNH